MLLAITKTAALPASVDDAWTFVSDPVRVAGCLPNVREFRALDEPGRYVALLVERVGPFGVQVEVTVDVEEDAAGRRMVARVAGNDRRGQARVRGEVTATVRPDAERSVLDVASDVEVLGRLATLGAGPIRRRGDQVFDEFVQTVAAQLEPGA